MYKRQDLYTLIDAAIEEEPPITVREGGIIKDGYHEEIDRCLLYTSRCV